MEGKSHGDFAETPRVETSNQCLNNTKVIQNFREPFWRTVFYFNKHEKIKMSISLHRHAAENFQNFFLAL